MSRPKSSKTDVFTRSLYGDVRIMRHSDIALRTIGSMSLRMQTIDNDASSFGFEYCAGENGGTGP